GGWNASSLASGLVCRQPPARAVPSRQAPSHSLNPFRCIAPSLSGPQEDPNAATLGLLSDIGNGELNLASCSDCDEKEDLGEFAGATPPPSYSPKRGEGEERGRGRERTALLLGSPLRLP